MDRVGEGAQGRALESGQGDISENLPAAGREADSN